ncbi:hypothetical protein BDV59DRAFT_207734 [Aspergillus ambiguus]|uniref:uncharacterized protein n=1 Tax=Aspergillus ambiguus TaxID=176160 RepID=UPI003CCE4740
MNDQRFELTVQLNTERDSRGYHQRNTPDEKQRADVVNDICQGLLLQARIDRIVHGRESKDGPPATLVVFAFRFHGLDDKRRLRQASITILFEDEKKRGADADPIVMGLWPDGDFILGRETPVDVEDTKGIEAGVHIRQSGVGLHAIGKWERKQNLRKDARASLTGSKMLDMDIREHGPDNAVRLTIKENPSSTPGVVTDMAAAVLLRRKNDDDRFAASVKIRAKGNFAYNTVRGLRNLLGTTPPNDPVIFQPGLQYLRPLTRGKLAEPICEEALNDVALDELAGALPVTILSTAPLAGRA